MQDWTRTPLHVEWSAIAPKKGMRMAVDPQNLISPYGPLIRKAREACEWRQIDAWNAYDAAGGALEFRTFVKWDMGKAEPSVSQFDIIASVFNARLQELGKPEAMLQRVLIEDGGSPDGNVIPITNPDQGGTATSRFVSLKVA